MGNICSCLPFFSSENENMVDVSPLLEMVSDVSQLDALISSIEQRLVAIANAMDKESASSSSAQETASSSAAQETAISLSAAQESASTSAAHETASSSAAQEAASSNDFHRFGNDLLEKVLTRVHGRGCKMCFMSKLNRETRKVVIDVLKGVGQSHWMAAGLSVLEYVLDQIDQVSANRGECVQLLRYMCALAKRLRQLNEQLPSEKEKLNEAVQFIVKGSIMCLGQMRSHPLFRFISASVGAADLQSIESQIRHIYPDLIFGAVVGVLERLPVVLPPSQGENLPATGVEAARDRVIGLLNMEMNDMSRIAVVVYGVGGIGKTTLATAAFKMLDLTGYKFCRVDIEQDCSVEYLKLLQKQILRDLFGRNIYLRSSEEGNQQLTESFREVKQPLFMFVDNALRGSDLARLLPTDLSALPKRMRILITTRKLNETDMLIHRDILRREYSVDCLSEAESKKMLCEKALCAPGSNFPQSVDIDSLVKVCGGIPLVLEMVASKLKRHVNNVPLCNEMVKSLKEALTEGEGDMSEKVVDVVYNSLDEDCREAFLDISCFFHNRGRRIVAYAVGIVELQALEDAALVKVSPHENYSEDRFNSLVYFVSHLDEQQGIVRVHDIVRARGRRLSQGDRITDMESLEEALEDTQMLQKIKGIRLPSEFTLEAEQLDRMNSSLRVLDNEALQINGRCRRRFPNLRYVDLGCGYLPMDLNKLKRLSVLSRPSIKDNVCELPSSLHLLRPSTVSNPDALLKNLGYLLWLEDLYIADPTIVSLPEHCLGQLKSLRFLDMSYSTSLSELPEDFGYLHALEGLSLNHCSQLASLTPNFGGLRSLKFLDMGYCEALVTLPDSFSNLSALQQLNLSFCSKLATLPPNFGQLSSLLSLNLYSTNLSAIPDSFGDLLSLKHLKLSRFIQSLSYLDNLDALPDTFGNLISLQTLDLRNCSQLASLPQSFSQLTHLETLDMSGCEKLSALPREFGQLNSLTYLNISDCKGLRTLSDCDFRGLTSLGGLNASGCSVLEGNSMDVLVQMISLIFVNINESPMLMARWQQVRERHPLIMLRSQSYSEGVGADWDEAISISLFHGENMFSYLDVDRQLAFRSTSDFPAPQAKLAFVMTMCDLSSPANTMALEMVKTKCAHLASQDFHIIFVEMENLPQKSEERMCQNLLHLPPGTHVWMAAGSKINQVFCNVLYARLYEANVWRDSWTACHTFVASASVSVEKDNKRCVRDLKRMIPDDNDDDSEALTDLQGGFKTQFHSLHEMGTMMTRRPTN